jgi:AcrR family transcriptional regulator
MARLADPGLAERRRRQILEAALVCFRRRGFHQATMQEICSEAGISPGALYRYFPAKADIIAAIAEDERRETDAMIADVRGQAGLVEALCQIAAAVFARFAKEAEAPIFADVFAEAARDPVLARRLSEIDCRSVERLAEALEAAQKRGEIDAGLDAIEAARTLIASVEGIAMRYAFGRSGSEQEGDLANFRALAGRYLAVQP